MRRQLGWLQALSPWLASHVGFRLFLTPSKRALDPEDAPGLASAQRHTLPFGNQTLAAYEWGTGQRLAVLLHGWGSHAPRFAALAAALVASGFRVVAFDAPAHGKSTGRQSSLPQFQRALTQVLAHFGPADLLLGHSLGALAMALSSGETPPSFRPPRALVLVSMPDSALFLVDRYEQMFGVSAATAAQLRRRFENRFGGAPEQFAASRIAARLGMPALVVHDRQDDVVPYSQAEALLPLLPRGHLLPTDGLGHSGLLRDPATINVITSFAQEHAGG